MDSAQTPVETPPHLAARALIAEIVPAPAECVDTREELDAELLAGELEHIARAVPSRRAEFVSGRTCARLALARLGLGPRPILAGARGEPKWPRGIVGSITHCAGYRGAVVARSAQIASVGIDAEPNAALPEGVLDAISLPAEQAWIERLSTTHQGVSWDRLLFSAKEAVYKAWYPLTLRWLDFVDAAVTVEPERGRFTAKLRTGGPVVGGREVSEFSGRWVVRENLILAAVTVPPRVPNRGGV
ncbi:4'-phosphopantetheinyl transferase family protein [Catenulispora yoronensis]